MRSLRDAKALKRKEGLSTIERRKETSSSRWGKGPQLLFAKKRGKKSINPEKNHRQGARSGRPKRRKGQGHDRFRQGKVDGVKGRKGSPFLKRRSPDEDAAEKPPLHKKEGVRRRQLFLQLRAMGDTGKTTTPNKRGKRTSLFQEGGGGR